MVVLRFNGRSLLSIRRCISDRDAIISVLFHEKRIVYKLFTMNRSDPLHAVQDAHEMLDKYSIGVVSQCGNIAVAEAFNLITAAAECRFGWQICLIAVGQGHCKIMTAGTVIADTQTDFGEQLIRGRTEGDSIAKGYNRDGKRLF